MDRFRSQSDPSDNISVQREKTRTRRETGFPGADDLGGGKIRETNHPLTRESLIAIRDGRAERVRE